jgi:hypothetical protein
VLAESPDIAKIVEAVTHYVASRMVERARALSEDSAGRAVALRGDVRTMARGRRYNVWRLLRTFVFGLLIGFAAVFAVLWVVASQVPK